MIPSQVNIDLVKGREFCFGCGPGNPIGLKLDFKLDGNMVRAEYTPSPAYQGWAGVVHGGIVSTILDEAMSWATFLSGVVTVTASMQTRLKRPAEVGVPMIITGMVTKDSRRLLETAATITLKDGTPVAEATATMWVVARKEDHKEEWPTS